MLEDVFALERRESRFVGMPRPEHPARLDAAARHWIGQAGFESRAFGYAEVTHDQVVNLEDARQAARPLRHDLQPRRTRLDAVDQNG